jgi:hypothetical protein
MSKKASQPNQLIDDIVSGMVYPRLLQAHNLTAEQFRDVFHQLITQNLVSVSDLKGFSSLVDPDAYDDSIFDAQSRRFNRLELDFPLPVYEAENPLIMGHIINMSKWGFKMAGIHCNKGEIRAFMTPRHRTLYLEPVHFEAICRWKGAQYTGQDPVGGFEVLDFYLGSFEILLENIASISMSERRSITEHDWVEV